MRRVRLSSVLPFAFMLLASAIYLLVKGSAYFKNPALLGVDRISILLSLLTYGLVLTAAGVAIARLVEAMRPGDRLNAVDPSCRKPDPALMSREDALQTIAAGAIRMPLVAVALAMFFAAIPVLMVSLMHGGVLAIASPGALTKILMAELPITALIAMVLIRIRRLKQQRSVDSSEK